METPTGTAVDPKSLNDTELVAEIKSAHLATCKAHWVGTSRANDCGQLLLEAKKRVGRGDFLRWVTDHRDALGFGVRMAQLYMKLAKRWSEIEEQKRNR